MKENTSNQKGQNRIGKVEIRTQVKDTVATDFVKAFPTAVQIDDYIYAIPMGVAEDNGAPLYAKVEIRCSNWYDTKNTKAFNLDDATALYEEKVEERAAKQKAAKTKKKTKEEEE